MEIDMLNGTLNYRWTKVNLNTESNPLIDYTFDVPENCVRIYTNIVTHIKHTSTRAYDLRLSLSLSRSVFLSFFILFVLMPVNVKTISMNFSRQLLGANLRRRLSHNVEQFHICSFSFFLSFSDYLLWLKKWREPRRSDLFVSAKIKWNQFRRTHENVAANHFNFSHNSVSRIPYHHQYHYHHILFTPFEFHSSTSCLCVAP